MSGSVTDLATYRKARPRRVAPSSVVSHLFNTHQQEVRQDIVDYSTWMSHELVSTVQSRLVKEAVANLLEAFNVNLATGVAATKTASIEVRFDLLSRERLSGGYHGLSLRSFVQLTLKVLSAVLNERLRVVEETDHAKPILTYIIIDKLRVVP